uniref:Chromosome 1 open reading frame 198 n=3 Tax=Otolemur garnettii TaxID=30611 RepID=H0XQW9_OTOGA
ILEFVFQDLTWQDEHSAPFSWETRSQMEFSVSSLSIQEPTNGSTAGEPRPLPKPSQGSQALKSSQGSRSSSLDALGPTRKEEEASFWKINAERSRGEGPDAEFQSLTPSQIKSIEKGEKVLPACYRQEPTSKDREAKVERPVAIRQEQHAHPGHTERERPQPAPSLTGKVPEATPAKLNVGPDDGEDVLFSEPELAQVSPSNVIKKTGFDFLDNW